MNWKQCDWHAAQQWRERTLAGSIGLEGPWSEWRDGKPESLNCHCQYDYRCRAGSPRQRGIPMGSQRLTHVPMATFGGHQYGQRQLWALVCDLQRHGYRVTLRCDEQDQGCLMYSAVVSNHALYAASGDQHGSPFLAIRACVDGLEHSAVPWRR